MKTLLFIEGYEVELNDKVQFLLNKQFEELDNPTVICNDWSKTVVIPFTEANNRLFGYIYKPNRIILGSNNPDSYKYMQRYFDPTKKLDFKLVYNSFILMEGYAKMNSITRKGNTGSYNITLNGLLGKMFQDMKKITFDESTSDSSYLIDGSQYVDEYINKELIYDSWMSFGQYRSVLKKKTDTGYHLTDIIGFAPNNSFSLDFNYDTYLPNETSSKTFAEVLEDTIINDKNFTQATGVSPDTIIPDGMLPREIGEYRSYLQLPFIYWNKLFQVFQAKAEEITGYTFELDDDWFNQTNPYWFNLVYMLKPFDVKKGDTKDNSYLTYDLIDMWRTDLGNYNSQRSSNFNVRTINYLNEPIYVSSNRFTLKLDADYTVFKTNFRLDLETSSAKRTSLKSNNALLVHITFTGENGNQLIRKYLFTDDTTNTYAGTDDYMYIQLDTATSEGGDAILRAYFSAFHSLSRTDFGSYADLSIQYRWYANSYPYSTSTSVSEIHITVANQGVSAVIMHNSFRSNGRFNLNDLWNNDYNLFEEILKYCKIFRIGISADNFNKKIIFKPTTEYFEDYSIEDWTDKVDMSKDFTIKPITFENKYILFNYTDNKTKSGAEYKEKFGVNYGEYRLATDYNFNTETTNLFDKVQTSITNTDNVLSWTNLHNNQKIIYSFPAEIFVYNKDKDKKQVDVFGSYYFHNGVSAFSTETNLNLRPVRISDDTAFQLANNTYCYTQSGGPLQSVEVYPNLDIVRGNNICLFNVPSENYTYLNNYSGKSSIYSNLWARYINERYNIQNKLITCYVTLTPSDYSSFSWNKFIKFDNIICMVNKIYDYDMTNNESTKVDLVTILNISGYTENNYQYDYIKTSESELTIPYDYYKQITVTASKRWEVKLDDYTDYLVVSPTSGSAGTTSVLIGTTDLDHGATVTFELYDDDDNVIGETMVSVAVGGVGTIVVDGNWYTEYNISSFNPIVRRNVTNSASGDWRIIKVSNGGGVSLNYNPAIGVAGSRQITYAASSSLSPGGIVDFYVGNDAGDITSFRVNFITSVTSTIYTLNSAGTEQQSTDSVDYRGLSSTRGYKVYSTSAWTLTLPTGVRSYGPTNGDAGTTDVTFDWGSGTLNSSKSITFTNNNGDTCELECTYVSL